MAKRRKKQPTIVEEGREHRPKNRQPHLAQELLDEGSTLDGIDYLVYHLRRPHREALLGTGRRRRRK